MTCPHCRAECSREAGNAEEKAPKGHSIRGRDRRRGRVSGKRLPAIRIWPNS